MAMARRPGRLLELRSWSLDSEGGMDGAAAERGPDGCATPMAARPRASLRKGARRLVHKAGSGHGMHASTASIGTLFQLHCE
jgi:hypothetical protein